MSTFDLLVRAETRCGNAAKEAFQCSPSLPNSDPPLGAHMGSVLKLKPGFEKGLRYHAFVFMNSDVATAKKLGELTSNDTIARRQRIQTRAAMEGRRR